MLSGRRSTEDAPAWWSKLLFVTQSGVPGHVCGASPTCVTLPLVLTPPLRCWDESRHKLAECACESCGCRARILSWAWHENITKMEVYLCEMFSLSFSKAICASCIFFLSPLKILCPYDFLNPPPSEWSSASPLKPTDSNSGDGW